MRKIVLLTVLVMLASVHLWAQRTISGRVTDERGTGIANVSVQVKGTTQGTVSDAEGRYSLTVPASARSLVFSAVDMGTREISIGSQTTINPTLQSADKSLQEVVVVGYGTQRRRDVTGAVSTVGGDRIKELPVQSFDQALSGKASGVNVSLPNGVLNNPPVIRVRGINSITLSSYPLIVVDGVPIYTGDLSTNSAAQNPLGNINPSDIEDVTILKDASAAAIYGSRAANGVLIITTKKGKGGKAKVNYETWAGWTKAANFYDVLDASQYVTMKNEAVKNGGGTSNLFFLDTINGQQVNTNWADLVYRTGFSQNHVISVNGSSENTRYYLSAGYTKQEGIIKTNEFDRKQIRLNLDQKVNKWLRIGTNTNFSRSVSQGPNSGSLPGQGFSTAGLARLAFVTAPNVSPYLANGQYNIMTPNDAAGRNNNNQIGRNKNLDRSGFYNPLLILDLNKFTSASDQFMGNVNAEISLFKGLSFRTQYGLSYNSIEDKTFLNPLHGDGINTTATNDDGDATNTYGKFTNRNLQGYFTYNTSFMNDHNINVVAGGEEQFNMIDRWGARRSGVADLFYNEFQGSYSINQNPVGNFITENRLQSLYGRVNYDFKKRYFISANYRRDGYSAFAEGKKFGNFGGGSIGWSISDESFWGGRIANVLSSLKFRASYGLVGNTQVSDFSSYSFFSGGNYGPYTTLFFSQAGNPDLTWEKVYKTDVGFSFGFLNDKITGEAGYYNSQAKDLIINVPTPPSMGIPGNSIPANTAEMYTRGFEFNVNARLFSDKKLNWNISFNITTQKNEVTGLAGGVTEIVGTTSGLERTNITRVGHPIGSLFGIRTVGVNPDNGFRIFLDSSGRKVQYNHAYAPGQRYRYMDGSIAPSIDFAKDAVMLGQTLPTVYGGLTNTFTYSGFDMTIDMIYNAGNYIYNGSRAGLMDQRFWNNHVDVLKRWQKAGDQTDIPRVVYNDNISNGSAFLISSNVEKGDFIKFRSIGVGYTLPRSLMDRANLGSLRFYAQVFNPFTITNYRGADPEISANGNTTIAPGVDRNTTFQPRTFTVGLNLGF